MIQGNPIPNINFERIASLNSARPETSYGGRFEREKSLQKNLRQQSSKMFDRGNQFKIVSNEMLSEIMKNNYN